MTRRERWYHWRKSKAGKARIAMFHKVWESYMLYGSCASRTYLDDNGYVHVDILSPEECGELLKKFNNNEEPPNDITFYTGVFDPTSLHN